MHAVLGGRNAAAALIQRVGRRRENCDSDKDAGQNANLDLARVYIEMDDVPAAKELLDEVVSQGSEEQKQEAESILKSIS